MPGWRESFPALILERQEIAFNCESFLVARHASSVSPCCLGDRSRSPTYCIVAGKRNPQVSTTIIHDTPKRSAALPKRGEKKVFASGICTCPSSATAANRRSASSVFAAVIDNEKPWKPV